MADEQEPQDPRQAAIVRLHRKRAFLGQVATYVVVNAVLVLIWALGSRGFFWPIFVIGFWGLGLAGQAWAIWFQKPISEADIEREMRRGE